MWVWISFCSALPSYTTCRRMRTCTYTYASNMYSRMCISRSLHRLFLRFSLSNGLEVLAVQDSSALEGSGVHVAASLAGGVLREPLHLPGLALLVAHCTFRGEKITAQFAAGPQNDSFHNPQGHQGKPGQKQQEQQEQQQESVFDSFAALLRALGGTQQLHLSITESETSLSFQVTLPWAGDESFNPRCRRA